MWVSNPAQCAWGGGFLFGRHRLSTHVKAKVQRAEPGSIPGPSTNILGSKGAACVPLIKKIFSGFARTLNIVGCVVGRAQAAEAFAVVSGPS